MIYQQKLKERFFSKFEKTVTCWIWKKPTIYGYGRIWVNGRNLMAHKISLLIHGIKLKKNLTVDHLCRNRACVNPDHLEQVTMKVNVLRGQTITAKNASKTHCLRGHEFNAKNTYKQKKKYRSCKICAHILRKDKTIIRLKESFPVQ